MELDDQPFRSGDLVYRAIQTTQGVVELLAEAVAEGATLQLYDVAVYPRGAAKLDLGVREVMALTRQLARDARQLGFHELHITGVRYSGSKPGREVNIHLNLNRPD